MVFLIAIYFLASHGTWALPIQDIDKSVRSCNDPSNGQTIWDIIWSCVVTIFSCTWLAIHPNIPGQEEGKGWGVLRRIGMFISAVIMPELMIFWAMRQWWVAHELEKRYKNFKWTLTHGFFALMGGFMLYEDDTPQYTLNPWELESYLISGQIKITKDEIQDKSKGDILTKGFVVLQTTWFIIQLIARAIERLPITELEIATLGFAGLNFVTYGVWWNKPLNVEFPFRVYSNTKHLRHSAEQVTEESSGEGEMVDRNVNSKSLNLVGSNTSLSRRVSEGGDKIESTDQTKHPPRSFKVNMLFDVLKNIRGAFQLPVDSFPSKLWNRYSDTIWLLLFPFMMVAAPSRDPGLKRGAKRVPTFYNGRIDDVKKDAFSILIMAVTPVTMLFGGIHCLAWAFPFPTHAEQLIWRVSSIFITSAPMATVVIGLAADSEAAQPLSWLSDVFDIFSTITLILYPVARLILLIQALMTLRSLPPDAYTTVQWTTFIPHI